MNKEQYEKAKQLTKQIEELESELVDSEKLEKLLSGVKNFKEARLKIKSQWSDWPDVYIKKEVAEVAAALTTKKLENELTQLTTEFENL